MLEYAELGKYSLDQWEHEFGEIYGKVDAHRTPAEMWLLMMEDAAKFAEAIRLEKYGVALGKIARVFGWACSYVARCRHPGALGEFELKKELSMIVWNKFPYRCCLCAQPRCTCSVRRGILEELDQKGKARELEKVRDALSVARTDTKDFPHTLDGFNDMFSSIYTGAHYSLPIEAIVLHLMEEVGEVASCIRDIREGNNSKSAAELLEALENEIADIISWIASSVSKLDYILGAPKALDEHTPGPQRMGLKLSEILWREFKDPERPGLWCRICRSRPCKCVPKAL